MLPLLTVVADMVGILGGMIVAVLRIGIPADAYLQGVLNTLAQSGFVFGIFPKDFVSGLLKPFVFGGDHHADGVLLRVEYERRHGRRRYGGHAFSGDLLGSDPRHRTTSSRSSLLVAAATRMNDRRSITASVDTRGACGAMLLDARRRRTPEPDHRARRRVICAFDRPILKNVSLDARKGETLMIVGESGTGK